MYLYTFFNLGARWGGCLRHAPHPRFTPGNDPVPIVQEAEWASGPVWTCADNLVPTGIRPPDHPDHIESLYRLSYSAPQVKNYTKS